MSTCFSLNATYWRSHGVLDARFSKAEEKLRQSTSRINRDQSALPRAENLNAYAALKTFTSDALGNRRRSSRVSTLGDKDVVIFKVLQTRASRDFPTLVRQARNVAKRTEKRARAATAVLDFA